MQPVRFSTLRVPEEWLQADFLHKAEAAYEVSTDSCTFSFVCHKVISTTCDHIVLYGQLWKADGSENHGWRILFIDKIEKKGSMHIIKTQLQPQKLTDTAFKSHLIARLIIGGLPSDSYLYA